MKYLIVNSDSTIDDVHDTLPTPQAGQTVETLDPDNDVNHALIIDTIKNDPFGHSVFKYVSGGLVDDTVAREAKELEVEKRAYENELIENELRLMAKERLTTVLQAVKNATSKTALRALKGQS